MMNRRTWLASLLGLVGLPFFSREKRGKKGEECKRDIDWDRWPLSSGLYKVTYERAKENKRELTEKEIAIVRRHLELCFSGLKRYNSTGI